MSGSGRDGRDLGVADVDRAKAIKIEGQLTTFGRSNQPEQVAV